MPKGTFLKLSKEKQEKVINSAKKEFARVPVQEVSIKNIVEDAGIARGSFYQYFESKEDLLAYILKEHIENINSIFEEKVKETKGNIFDIYIFIYDSMVENFVVNDKMKLFEQIFKNIKSSEEDIFRVIKKNNKPKDIVIEYYDIIDKSDLKITNKEDFELICNLLNMITRKAIIKNFKYDSKEKARNEFLKQINYLKYGIIKMTKTEPTPN